ncbi:MAG TPA: type I-E CRISPR-associated protein Cse2/CasB [Verrucomicrobiota bacterium]|nr:type I-E CRISPR-associated protein Cse2/CasB [Verrucomicrobiota bacterium]
MVERFISHVFTEGDESSGILLAWWVELEQNRDERASLRRARSPQDVAYCPSFHRLLNQMRGQGYPLGVEGATALAVVAGVIAHVKAHTADASVAENMATPKMPGGGARVSGLRFRRILVVPDRDELYPHLVRIVRLLGGSVNLVSLANAAFWWNERTKKEWAYKYYATAPTTEL